MRVERVEGILSGGVSPIYRNRKVYVSKRNEKMQCKPAMKKRLENLFERATSHVAQMLTEEGKATYGRRGTTKDYDDMIGRIIDEKV